MIGKRIKNLRESRNWSQLFLAKKAGISNSVLSRIESEKRAIDNHLLIIFADIFGVSADYLLGRTDDPSISGCSSSLPSLTQPRDLAEFLDENEIIFKGKVLNNEEKRKIKAVLTAVLLDFNENQKTDNN